MALMPPSQSNLALINFSSKICSILARPLLSPILKILSLNHWGLYHPIAAPNFSFNSLRSLEGSFFVLLHLIEVVNTNTYSTADNSHGYANQKSVKMPVEHHNTTPTEQSCTITNATPRKGKGTEWNRVRFRIGLRRGEAGWTRTSERKKGAITK
jgi:hypothetical protein